MGALADAVARSFTAGEPERPAVSPLRALGRRQLSPLELLGQSVATTAPAASMVLLPVTMFTHETWLPGLVTIVAATAVIMLMAHCIAQFTRRLAASGGLYTFTFQGLGTRAAVTCGVGLLVKYLGSGAITMYHGGQAVLVLAAQSGLQLRGWGVAAVYVAVALAIASALVRGVRFAAVAILAVEACSLLFIVGLLIAGSAGVAPPVPPTAPAGPGVLFVAMRALFGLAGFESATFFAPETRRPLVTVTRTVLLTPLLCGTLFIFAGWAACTGRADVLFSAYLHGAAGGVSPVVVILLNIGLTCSWLASSMASSNAASRLVYSMSLEGVLPGVFTRIGARLRTPHMALAVIVGITTTGGLIYVAADGIPAAAATAVRTALVTAYILVAVATVRFLRRIRETTRIDWYAGWLGAAALTATLACLMITQARDGTYAAAATVACVLAAGAAWHRYLRVFHPRSLRAIGVFDSPESADVLPGAGMFAVNARGSIALVGANRRGPDEP
ncbi:APC family permease [Nocardia crassostreae]|uniref:APC family permease n=1 Tax=Nocardia crassostreae TaxID=53428 RepID=UPI00082DBBB1|nr:APC family permease [Nocardia crassostreae]